MSAAGNIDRALTDDEVAAAGKAVAAFVKALAPFRREVATYTLSVIVTAMGAQEPDPKAAERQVLKAVTELVEG